MVVLSVRQMQEQEINLVLNIVNADYRQFFDNQQPLSAGTLRRWFLAQRETNYLFFVGELDGQVIAFASMCCGRNTYLGMLAVHRDFRGRGFGRALFEHCINFAQNSGCVRFYFEAREDNSIMQGLVQQFGFEQEGYFRNQMRDGCATVRYVRFLEGIK